MDIETNIIWSIYFWVDLGASGGAFEAAVALFFGGRGSKKWLFFVLGAVLI